MASGFWEERNWNKKTGRLKRVGSQVNAVDSKEVETRTCSVGKKGHLTKTCPRVKNSNDEDEKSNDDEKEGQSLKGKKNSPCLALRARVKSKMKSQSTKVRPPFGQVKSNESLILSAEGI
jgi:hypothetical protein